MVVEQEQGLQNELEQQELLIQVVAVVEDLVVLQTVAIMVALV